MKPLIKIFLFSAMLAVPVAANAQTSLAPKSASGMNCPMMTDKSAMQKDMGAMMKDMSAMMTKTSDPSMKGSMQKMHNQMSAMMAKMQMMSGGMGGMKGGAMMQDRKNSGKAPSVASPAAPDDHAAHHPAQ